MSCPAEFLRRVAARIQEEDPARSVDEAKTIVCAMHRSYGQDKIIREDGDYNN